MKITYFESPAQLRQWMTKNHDKTEELWIGFYKQSTGKASVTYPEALDQALCFGWIDGIRKRVDEDSYTIRFTPRKPRSIWSMVNIKRAGELIALGLMQPAGLKAFQARDEQLSKQYSYEREHCQLDAEYLQLFRKNKKAWNYFQAQSPAYQRNASWFVMSAKRAETRLKRLATLIEDCQNHRKLANYRPEDKKK